MCKRPVTPKNFHEVIGSNKLTPKSSKSFPAVKLFLTEFTRIFSHLSILLSVLIFVDFEFFFSVINYVQPIRNFTLFGSNNTDLDESKTDCVAEKLI